MLNIITLPALQDNYIYLLHDEDSGMTAVVDPADAAPVLTKLEVLGWKLDYVFCTHHHGDHIDGNLALKQKTGCQIVAAHLDIDKIPRVDLAVADGDCLHLGQHRVEVIATPGHTLGHIAYYLPDNQALFCGDTLFSLGCGRLLGGTAEQLWQSLQRLKNLPDATAVYCAHEYTLANARFALTVDSQNSALLQRIADAKALVAEQTPTLPSTIALEKACNPFLRADCPDIQTKLNMSGESSVKVFATLRTLKDIFV